MKKKISFLILIFIFSAFFIVYKNVSNAASNSINPEKTYGFKLSIMNYSGSGEPKRIGRPILVVQKGLLNDATVNIAGSYPSGSGEDAYNQLMNGNYGLYQFIPKPLPEGTVITTITQGDPNNSPEDNADLNCPSNGQHDLSHQGQATADWLETPWGSLFADVGTGATLYGSLGPIVGSGENMSPEQFQTIVAEAGLSGDEAEDMIESYTDNYQEYMNNPGQYTQYYGSATQAAWAGIQEAYGTALLHPLTISQNIAVQQNNGMNNTWHEGIYLPDGCPSGCVEEKTSGPAAVDQKIFRYMSGAKIIYYKRGMIDLREYNEVHEEDNLGNAEEVVIKYANSAADLKRFGIDYINPMEMKNIYVQVEVVQRYLPDEPNKQVPIGNYLVKSFTHVEKKPTDWTLDDFIDVYGCKTPWGLYGSRCSMRSGVFKTIPHFQNCPYGWDEERYLAFQKRCYERLFKDQEVVCYNFTVNDCHGGINRVYYIYGTKVVAPSYIITVRGNEKLFSVNYADKAKNSCSSTAHEILDANGKKSGKYEYYIGPNLENALVGPASTDPNQKELKNKHYTYTISGAKWDKNKYTCSGSSDAGIQHFYFLNNFSCSDECLKVSKDKSSNEYLNCVEQYAENSVDVDLYNGKGNARKRKQQIIFDQCGYTYGISPNEKDKNKAKKAKDRESENSCNNTKAIYSTNIINNNSSCNVVNSTFVQNIKGVKADACIGDQVTDFDNKENDTSFDMRSYINTVCKDTTTFEFKDTSQISLTKGGGFTYPVKQEGERECTYSFNLEQWKVDYAVSPARTKKKKSEERIRLQCVLDKFNAAITGKEVKCDLPADSSEDIPEYGNTHFEKKVFKFESTPTTKVNEQLKTSEKTKKETLIMEKTDENISTSRLQTIDNNKLIRVSDGKITKNIPVNKYISVFEGNALYELDKVCISSDGLATVSPAPENGICSKKNETSTNASGQLVSNIENVLAERKYYTSFQINEKKDSKISSTVTVGNYYTNNESCTYNVNPYSCTLEVKEDTTVKKLGDKKYEIASNVKNKKLTVGINYKIDKALINSINILDNGTSKQGEEVEIKNKEKNSVEVHNLEGRIALKNGKTVTCGLTIELNTQTSCGLTCTITKVNNKLYKISANQTDNVNFYTYTNNHIMSTANEFKNSIYPYMKKVVGDALDKDKTRYIRLSSVPKDEELVLYGYVTKTDSSCNNTCKYVIAPGPDPKTYDCNNLFKPLEREDIKNYCSANWDKDINGYDDEGDCFARCSNVCPNNCSDEKAVADYCKNAEALGFEGGKDYAQLACQNMCYCNKDYSDDYEFRSINIYNPFPNSETGDRLIGKNWNFLTEYITDDSSDTTAVTGKNKDNTYVEYIIDINPSAIRKIRADIRTIDENIASVKNKRKAYAKLDRVKSSSKNLIEAYKSEFINTRFPDLFQKDHGKYTPLYGPGSSANNG